MIDFVKFFLTAISLVDLWWSLSFTAFFICRDFVCAWTFPYGALYILGKTTPFSGFPVPFRFTVICIRFKHFHVCLLFPLACSQALLVQCWGIRLEILLNDWMSKWIIKCLSGYTQWNTPQIWMGSHYPSKGVLPSALLSFLNSLPFYCYIDYFWVG